MAENGQVALVSGTNRRIGLEIVRHLAERTIAKLLGSRDEKKRRDAAEEPCGNVVVRQLDATDEKAVYRLARRVEEESGRLDALVNNAGIADDRGQRGVDADPTRIREALEANLIGAWRLREAFVPLMRRDGCGRVVNVSGGMGILNDIGGGSAGYCLLRADLNVLTRTLVSELRGSGILVNSACPGWVERDMGGPGASRFAKDGADTPVRAATLPDSGPTGGFFRDRRPIPW